MLAHRRRRWANIVPTLAEHFGFAGLSTVWLSLKNTRPAITAKHETLIQFGFNAGPPFAMLAQNSTKPESMSGICWAST